MSPPSSALKQVKYSPLAPLQSELASQAQNVSLHMENAHVWHAVGFAPTAQVPPSSPEDPPEPPVPVVVVDVDVVLVEPAAPDEVLPDPPSPLSTVASVVQAPSTAITVDAAQIVMFFIVSLLAISYPKPLHARATVHTRCPYFLRRPTDAGSISRFVRTSQIAGRLTRRNGPRA
jgi:hypothetical protein